MIVLDTNVLSETLRARPEPSVLDWLGSITDTVAITAISVGEIFTGVRLLPAGRRRTGLTDAIGGVLAVHADRVLPYDERAARIYAELQERRHAAGRPLSVEDGMIAAVCLVHNATLATRNVKDFLGLQIELINPWS